MLVAMARTMQLGIQDCKQPTHIEPYPGRRHRPAHGTAPRSRSASGANRVVPTDQPRACPLGPDRRCSHLTALPSLTLPTLRHASGPARALLAMSKMHPDARRAEVLPD